jgi:hypothetical protein
VSDLLRFCASGLLQRGRCHYGERCRFSQDVNKASDFKSNPAAYHLTTHDLGARNQYFDWKRLLRNGILGSGYSRREHEEIVQFWIGAIEILESDSRKNHQFRYFDLDLKCIVHRLPLNRRPLRGPTLQLISQ